jgi:hypothetical protein
MSGAGQQKIAILEAAKGQVKSVLTNPIERVTVSEVRPARPLGVRIVRSERVAYPGARRTS